MFSIKNKTIIVTGASGVIGSTIAQALEKSGATIILLGRNPEKLEKTFDKINDNIKHRMYSCDVLDIGAVEKIKVEIERDFDNVDALINVAGGATKGASTKTEFLTDETPMEDSFFGVNLKEFIYTNDLNFIGSVIPTKVFGELMARQKSGNIINISSMGAIQPLSKSPAYSAGKAAITNFTQWLAVHLSKVNIRVNAIAQGFIFYGEHV
jgi:NAD(P)-dependent dehydrogenase (short-subunit alcohol dehydrogenase family)